MTDKETILGFKKSKATQDNYQQFFDAPTWVVMKEDCAPAVFEKDYVYEKSQKEQAIKNVQAQMAKIKNLEQQLVEKEKQGHEWFDEITQRVEQIDKRDKIIAEKEKLLSLCTSHKEIELQERIERDSAFIAHQDQLLTEKDKQIAELKARLKLWEPKVNEEDRTPFHKEMVKVINDVYKAELKGKQKPEKPAKICKCGCFDLDHEISQVYGLYHCLNCKKSCVSEDFKPLPKDRQREYFSKYLNLKRQGKLC